MCEIMEEAIKEAVEELSVGIKAEGKAEGAIETVIKLGLLKNQTDEQIIDDIATICEKTKEEAENLFALYKPQIA